MSDKILPKLMIEGEDGLTVGMCFERIDIILRTKFKVIVDLTIYNSSVAAIIKKRLMPTIHIKNRQAEVDHGKEAIFRVHTVPIWSTVDQGKNIDLSLSRGATLD